MLGRVILVAGLLTISAVAHSATRSRAVLDSPLDVPAVTWKSIPIVVTSTMPDAHLQGDVRASGGTGNDIEILLMTEADWTNFSNGHHAEVLFKSGRTTVSTLDVPLPEGAYRLVFSNTFSGITPKRITGSVLVSWNEADNLPAGNALKAQVHFVKIAEGAHLVTVPIRTPHGPGQVVLRSAEGSLGPFSVSVRRPQGASTLERVLGSVDAMAIKEAGVIDVDADGTEDVYFVAESGGTGSATDELVVASANKLALVSYSITQSFTAGAKPEVATGDNFSDPRFAAEQSFLQRIAEAYLPSTADAVAQEDDPRFIFDTWVKDNGGVTAGPMTIRRLKAPPADLGSALAEITDGTVTYRACFKSGVLAIDHSTGEHYALFYPKDQYAWPTVLKKLGPFLLIGTRGEGLAIVDTRDFSLKRIALGATGNDVERIEIVGAKIRVNGVVDVDAPSY